jgi:mannosyl-glycoprotein endo-beta-N-acetylglucosaminidase
VSELIEWLKYLTKEVHAEVPHGEVIWYDSITTSGALRWQNCLNELNYPFFDAYVVPMSVFARTGPPR